jgi:hypothetical protein
MLAAGDPKPFNIFLVFVFCGWWVIVAGCLIWVLFGHERLVLDRQGASFLRRAIVLLLRREVPLRELRSFEGYTEVSGGRTTTVRHGIEMRTVGESLRFAEGIAVGERDWLTSQLNDHLRSLRGTGEQAASQDWPAAVAGRVVRDSTHAAVAPPSDARWERLDDRDSIVFADKGWFSVGALVGLLAVNMLWNGIVSVFVLGLSGVGPVGPQGAAWWFVFIFMIPFEFFGVAMLLALVVAIVEPARRAAWCFGHDSIEYHQTWFGLGSLRNYSVVRPQRIELRVIDSAVTCFSFWAVARDMVKGGGALGRTHQLALVGPGDKVLCTIDALTDGEARWMADMLLRERPSWFR